MQQCVLDSLVLRGKEDLLHATELKTELHITVDWDQIGHGALVGIVQLCSRRLHLLWIKLSIQIIIIVRVFVQLLCANQYFQLKAIKQLSLRGGCGSYKQPLMKLNEQVPNLTNKFQT